MVNFKKVLFTNMPVARYNLAAWTNQTNGNVYLIGREVEMPGKTGEPDFGKLILIEQDPDGKTINERVIWEPLGDSLWLEDPRALTLLDGSVVIGLTALMREKVGYRPYPAITRLSNWNWSGTLPAITLLENIGAAKNVTPIDDHIFFCRPESSSYNHKLLVFSFKDLIARALQDVEFPKDLPWADWRTGTTMPPIWISDTKALLIFHGITKREGKYVYSLGRAALQRQGDEFHIFAGREPILTPDDFLDQDGRALVPELHPELRRVVYSCGGVVKRGQKENLTLYVNVGDRATFEVEFALGELTKGLF